MSDSYNIHIQVGVEGEEGIKTLGSAFEELRKKATPRAPSPSRDWIDVNKIVGALGFRVSEGVTGAVSTTINAPLNLVANKIKSTAGSLANFGGSLGRLGFATLGTASSFGAFVVVGAAVAVPLFNLGVTVKLLRSSFRWAKDAADEEMGIIARAKRTFPGAVGEALASAKEQTEAKMNMAGALFGNMADALETGITRRFSEAGLQRALRGGASGRGAGDALRRWGINPVTIQMAEQIRGQRLGVTDWLALFVKERESLEARIAATAPGSALQQQLIQRRGQLVTDSLRLFNSKFADFVGSLSSEDLVKLRTNLEKSQPLGESRWANQDELTKDFNLKLAETQNIFKELKQGIQGDVQPIFTEMFDSIRQWMLPVEEGGSGMGVLFRELLSEASTKAWQVLERLLAEVKPETVKKFVDRLMEWDPQGTIETLWDVTVGVKDFAVGIAKLTNQISRVLRWGQANFWGAPIAHRGVRAESVETYQPWVARLFSAEYGSPEETEFRAKIAAAQTPEERAELERQRAALRQQRTAELEQWNVQRGQIRQQEDARREIERLVDEARAAKEAGKPEEAVEAFQKAKALTAQTEESLLGIKGGIVEVSGGSPIERLTFSGPLGRELEDAQRGREPDWQQLEQARATVTEAEGLASTIPAPTAEPAEAPAAPPAAIAAPVSKAPWGEAAASFLSGQIANLPALAKSQALSILSGAASVAAWRGVPGAAVASEALNEYQRAQKIAGGISGVSEAGGWREKARLAAETAISAFPSFGLGPATVWATRKAEAEAAAGYPTRARIRAATGLVSMEEEEQKRLARRVAARARGLDITAGTVEISGGSPVEEVTFAGPLGRELEAAERGRELDRSGLEQAKQIVTAAEAAARTAIQAEPAAPPAIPEVPSLAEMAAAARVALAEAAPAVTVAPAPAAVPAPALAPTPAPALAPAPAPAPMPRMAAPAAAVAAPAPVARAPSAPGPAPTPPSVPSVPPEAIAPTPGRGRYWTGGPAPVAAAAGAPGGVGGPGGGFVGGGGTAGGGGATGTWEAPGAPSGPAPTFGGAVSPSTNAALVREMTVRMAPAGSRVGAPSGSVTITSPSGRKFTVDREFAANFQGFINDYEAAGGVIGPASGGLAARPSNASYHPRGYAIDINQIGYGIRSKTGVTLSRAQEEQLAAEWGIFPGSQFRGRSDIGHFEVRNREAARRALERKNAAGGGLPPVQGPIQGGGPPAPEAVVAAGGASEQKWNALTKGTPLEGQWAQVVAAAQKYGVPPHIMGGVMLHETGRGKNVRGNNPAGLMDPKTQHQTKQTFQTIGQGIDASGKVIGKWYNWAGGDLRKMQSKYAPSVARNDPTGQNRFWVGGVTSFAGQLGGGGSGVQVAAAAAAPTVPGPGARFGSARYEMEVPTVPAGTPAPVEVAPEAAAPMPVALPEGGGRVIEQQGRVAATRRLPLAAQTKGWLEAGAAAAGVTVEVFSGGQAAKGTGGPRTGSTRHDLGGAADVKLRDPATGRLLNMNNPADRARMEAFVAAAVAAGATGVGAGLGYMGASSIHVGGGRAATWGGAGWVAGAYARGMQGRGQAPSAVSYAAPSAPLPTAAPSYAPARRAYGRGGRVYASPRGRGFVGGGGGFGGGGATGTWAAAPGPAAPPPPARVTGGGVQNVLAQDRARFAAEIQAKPHLRDQIAAMGELEVGSQPAAWQGHVEAMMNRASATGKSLEATLNSKYYDPYKRGAYQRKLKTGVSSAERAKWDQYIEGALAGANTTNLATGTASGPEAAFGRQGYFGQGAGGGRIVSLGGEHFGEEAGTGRWRRITGQRIAAAPVVAPGAPPPPTMVAASGPPAPATAGDVSRSPFRIVGGAKERGAEQSWSNLQPELRSRLSAMYREMPDDLKQEMEITSGWRSLETQRRIYMSARPGMAAKPSLNAPHVSGRAVDFGGLKSFQNTRAYRWMMANKQRFGLTHLGQSDRPGPWEPWHWEVQRGAKPLPQPQLETVKAQAEDTLEQETRKALATEATKPPARDTSEARDVLTRPAPRWGRRRRQMEEGSVAGKAAADTFKKEMEDFKVPIKQLSEETKERETTREEREEAA